MHGIQTVAASVAGPAVSARSTGCYGGGQHSLLIGVRYQLGAVRTQAAVQPPTPAPQMWATRTFLVFFDWNGTSLNARARAIIAEAAQRMGFQGNTRL